ncbi:MAG: ABC transporter substrate-binding protein [Dehalococcoidia bacterium]|nr:ABC transporter substrate-binding protein [Dehalococcoidia bacterium]
MARRRLLVIAAAVLAVVMVVAGTTCTSGPTPTPVVVVATPTAGPTPTTAIGTETLLIGNLSILSGAGTGYGFSAARGVERGIELWNDAGGLVVGGKRYMLKIDTYDWGYTADSGRTAAEKAINDGCKIIFGVGTANTAGAQQTTEPNKVLLLAQTASNDLVTTKFPYTFRILMGADGLYSPGMDYVWDKYPDKRKLFVTAWNDATGKLVWETWKPLVNAMGWSKVDFQYYEPGTTDFAPFINSYLLPANPDVFALVSRTGETGLLIKAARQFGYKGIIYWAAGGGSVPELQIAGDLAEGVIVNQEWDWKGQFVPEAAKPEALSYLSRYGSNPTVHLITALDGLRMLAAAMKKANSVDTTAIRDTLPTIEWDSYWGGKGKLYPVKDRPGATMNFGMPVSVCDSKNTALVNVGFGLPPALKTK